MRKEKFFVHKSKFLKYEFFQEAVSSKATEKWKTTQFLLTDEKLDRPKIKNKFRNEFSGFLSEHNPDFRLFNH